MRAAVRRFLVFDFSDPVQRVGLLVLGVFLVADVVLAVADPRTPVDASSQAAPAPASGVTFTVGDAPITLGSEDGAQAPAAVVPDLDLGATADVSFTVVNAGTEPDRLLGASSELASRVQLVAPSDPKDGTGATTRPLDGGLAIPPGGSAELAPDGPHLLLEGIADAKDKGETFTLTLRFERAGDVTVPVQVRHSAEKALASAAGPVAAGDLRVENAWARAVAPADPADPADS